eukprot:TRINITY_DN1188_c0_g1_i15.p1 TRINITY_DN1188_c0_g1~~TRINITY_DN1188_c0_g1_i15.p1  ORF type:complete len:219 (-),score=76.58 TRINITY_DN1188_c0_g1_i15:170-826(-)
MSYVLPLPIRIASQKKKEDEESMKMQESAAAAQKQESKKGADQISFKPQSFTNSAMTREFPSIAEAAKMDAAPKRPAEKEPKAAEKEPKLTTPYFNNFVNSKKDYSKPSFKGIEMHREGNKRNECGAHHGYKKDNDLKPHAEKSAVPQFYNSNIEGSKPPDVPPPNEEVKERSKELQDTRLAEIRKEKAAECGDRAAVFTADVPVEGTIWVLEKVGGK